MRGDKSGSRQKEEREQKEALQEELLSEAFNACMEEQLSFIPPEREIARMHTFSEEFKSKMEKLCRTNGKLKRQEMTRREFVFGFNRIAACILMMLAVGGICVGGYLISKGGAGGSGADSAASTEESTEQAADMALPEEETAAGNGSSEATADGGADAEGGDGEFMGQSLLMAEEQALPSESNGIRMLISSPVVDREAEDIKVTFGNLTEETVTYSRELELQVCLDGVWYVVPKLSDSQSGPQAQEEEQEQPENEPGNGIVELESGMAQDEKILLSEYELDYEAELYRVVSRIDDRLFASEFRFETLEEGLEEALDSTLNEMSQ